MQNWFEKIFAKYIDDIYRLAYSYTHNNEDSEDIVQKVFLKYFNKQETINKNEEEVKKWLIIITINECKDLFKSSWKKKVSLKDDENIFQKIEIQDNFEQYMERLPKKYRIIFHLYYYYGYNSKEIAELMKMKEATVRQRLARGRKILKLERDLENEEL